MDYYWWLREFKNALSKDRRNSIRMYKGWSDQLLCSVDDVRKWRG